MSISVIAATSAILAATTQPSAGDTNSAAEWLVAAAVTAVALGAGAWAGAFRPRRVGGPPRIPPHQSLGLWVALVVFAGVAWFGTLGVLSAVKQFQLQRTHGPEARLEPSMLTAGDFALLTTVPFVAAFVCLLAGGLFLSRDTPRRLGFTFTGLPIGLLKGLAGTFLVLPLMFWVLVGITAFYRWIAYQHPAEHDLLREMTQAQSPVARWALAAGAVLVAPVFEEFFFRGHLQTVIRTALGRLSDRGPWGMLGPDGLSPLSPAPGFEPLPMPLVPPPPPPPGAAPLAPPQPLPPPVNGAAGQAAPSHAWQTWLAIVCTSVLFMLVHYQGSAWMFPPIFILSVCIGYAYERTGNLWVPITIHAMFNASSTVLYLWQHDGARARPLSLVLGIALAVLVAGSVAFEARKRAS